MEFKFEDVIADLRRKREQLVKLAEHLDDTGRQRRALLEAAERLRGPGAGGEVREDRAKQEG